jgi:hypothetical protein
MKSFGSLYIILLFRVCCVAQQGEDPKTTKPPSPNRLVGTYSTTAGIWLPQSDLSILGAHPSIGFAIGLRNQENELDLNISARFIRTPQEYLVQRGGALYSLHYFVGGYIGLDYTRYFMVSRRWEFGALVGLGYDGFDIADSYENNPGDNDYLKPLDLGTFNYNLGLRFNYYYKPGMFIGITPRYSFLRYINNGGSSLFGNAFSIDFSVGGF